MSLDLVSTPREEINTSLILQHQHQQNSGQNTPRNRREERWARATTPNAIAAHAAAHAASSPNREHRSSSSKSRKEKKKKKHHRSSSKSKKTGDASASGGDGEEGSETYEDDEDEDTDGEGKKKSAHEDLLAQALAEQQEMLAFDVVFNRAPEWATKVSDLTLLHELELNRDAPYVSQGVLDEMNRDVTTAVNLHNNEVMRLDAISLEPLTLDMEEERRACPPPHSYPPPQVSERLANNLTEARDGFLKERPIGLSTRLGEDGVEVASSIPDAADIMRHANLQRAIMQDEFPCHGSSQEGPYPSTANATSLFLRGYRSGMPKVHAEFIVDPVECKGDDTVLIDAGSARLLRSDEELLGVTSSSSSSSSSRRFNQQQQEYSSSSPSSSSLFGPNNARNKSTNAAVTSSSSPGDGKKIITVNLGSLRIREHPLCTREHYFAHHLLDAYTQYKMLTSNLLPGLKSRKHYEIIVEQLNKSLTRRQRLNAVGGSGSGSSSSGLNPSRASSSQSEEIQLTEQLAAAKTKLGMSVEMEQQTLTTMWNSWKELCDLWRGNAAAASDMINNQNNQNTNTQNVSGGMGLPLVRLKFSLIKRDDPEQTPYSDGSEFGSFGAQQQQQHQQQTAATSTQNNQNKQNNILDYVPNVVVEEPSSVDFLLRSKSTNEMNSDNNAKNKSSSSSTSKNANASNINNQLQLTGGSSIAIDSIFVLKLYVKSSEAAGLTLVGISNPKCLDSAFGVSFNETFELHVAREPQAMMIRVCLYPSDKIIAEVNIPPSLTHAAHELSFTTGEKFVGSTDSMLREIGGVVVASTTWTTDSGLTVESIERLFLNGEADPLDPRNAHLVAALRRHYQLRAAQMTSALSKPMISLLGRSTTASSTATTSSLRKTSGLYAGDFIGIGGEGETATAGGGEEHLHIDSVVTPQPVLLDRRLQLLNLKWKISSGKQLPLDTFETRITNTQIPATSTEAVVLSRNMKTECDTEELEMVQAKHAKAAGGADPKDSGKAWILKLREKKMQKKPQPLSDEQKMTRLITLPTIPTIGDLFANISNWFIPHSGLNPPRELRSTVEDADRAKVQEKWGTSTITAHIMKASNLPIREDGSPIRAFIELRFVDKAVCTLPQPGCDPSWFETLSVPFEPEDFEDDTLGFIDDDIILSIYDEFQVPLPTTATTNPNSLVTHYRIERRFLGAVKIPFWTLYNSDNASIEAAFRVFQPRSAFGYVLSPIAMPTVNLYVSLWPPLKKIPVPKPSFAQLKEQILSTPAGPALRELSEHALEWSGLAEGAVSRVSALQPKAANREMMPFAPGSSRDQQLICRFLRGEGINLPPGIVTIPEAIRFVSLFPFEVDMVTSAEGDEWSTVPEFLQMGVGDYEELGILLALLLRALTDAPIMLVTGMGDVYTQAVYVLAHINGVWKLIDPRTGDIFDISDPLTGLSEVSLVISHNQIWGNIQMSGMPFRMLWDFDDPTYWLPMFDAAQRGKMSGVESLQPANIVWQDAPSHEACIIFEDEIRRAVKATIRQLRRDKNITFQERVAVLLKDVLICMEDERRINANIQHPVVAEATQKAMQEFSLEYMAVGSPVNKNFKKYPSVAGDNGSGGNSLTVQLGPLLDSIRESAIHEVGASGTKYAVSVHCRPYPAGLFSVWVYAVALVHR